MTTYIEAAFSLLKEVETDNEFTLKKIARELAERITRGGIIQLFGSGHSQLLAQEGFYRAGSLVPVKPISIGPLMLHEGALLSSLNEKDTNFSKTFLASLDIRPEDAVIIISTSGRNPVPLDVAHYAVSKGAYTVSLQSLRYTEAEHPSKHVSEKRLESVVSSVLDTKVPPGDGILTIDGVQCGPVSSLVGNALLHELYCEIISCLKASGAELPVFKSGNLEGNQAHNEKWVAHYSSRIEF